MKTRLIYIGIALTVIVSAFLVAFFTANPKPADATVETHSTCMPVEACEATTTTVQATTSTTQKVVLNSTSTTETLKSPTTQAPAESTTTTSEVPPPLTPEQEAKIGKFTVEEQFCFDTGKTYPCKTPEVKGMGEDVNGTDYGIVQSDEQ